MFFRRMGLPLPLFTLGPHKNVRGRMHTYWGPILSPPSAEIILAVRRKWRRIAVSGP